MGQIQNVPGPSQAAFNTLNDQMGNFNGLEYKAISGNSSYTFSGCGLGSVIIARQTSQTDGIVRIVTASNDTTKVIGTVADMTISVSNYNVTITNTTAITIAATILKAKVS